tara:strand:+ start:22057 stop:22341 length:285 start_codon:yes stop_codon:yes gene_type:complete
MPDWIERYAGWIKIVGGAFASVLAIGAGWLALDWPVPATRDWVESEIEMTHEREQNDRLLAALDKALAELGPGDARDAVQAQRDALQAKMDQSD